MGDTIAFEVITSSAQAQGSPPASSIAKPIAIGGGFRSTSYPVIIIVKFKAPSKFAQVTITNNGAGMIEIIGSDSEDISNPSVLLKVSALMPLSDWKAADANSASVIAANTKQYSFTINDKLDKKCSSHAWTYLKIVLKGFTQNFQYAFGLRTLRFYSSVQVDVVGNSTSTAAPINIAAIYESLRPSMGVEDSPAPAQRAASSSSLTSPSNRPALQVTSRTGRTLSLEFDDDELMADEAEDPIESAANTGSQIFQYDKSKFEQMKQNASAPRAEPPPSKYKSMARHGDNDLSAIGASPPPTMSKASIKVPPPQRAAALFGDDDDDEDDIAPRSKPKPTAPKKVASVSDPVPAPAPAPPPVSAPTAAPPKKKSAASIFGESSDTKKVSKPAAAAPKKPAVKQETAATGEAMPEGDIMKGLTLVISGIGDPERKKIRDMAAKLGAGYSQTIPAGAKGSSAVLVYDETALADLQGTSSAQPTEKFLDAQKAKCPIVTKKWIYDQFAKKMKLPTKPYDGSINAKKVLKSVSTTDKPKKKKKGKKADSDEEESDGPDEYDFDDGFLVEDESDDDVLGIRDDNGDDSDSDDEDYRAAIKASRQSLDDTGDVSATFAEDEMDWETAKDDKEAAKEARAWLSSEGVSKKRPRRRLEDWEGRGGADDDDFIELEIDEVKPPLSKKGSRLSDTDAGSAGSDSKVVQFERWKKYISEHPANKK